MAGAHVMAPLFLFCLCIQSNIYNWPGLCPVQVRHAAFVSLGLVPQCHVLSVI